jgi:hypothetical protein
MMIHALIPAFQRLMQEDHEFQSSLMGHIGGHCLKNKQRKIKDSCGIANRVNSNINGNEQRSQRWIQINLVG